MDLYNAGDFFEAHEVWEDVWLEEEGDVKAFLQGVIKIAAAFHHLSRGTYRGMWDLLIAGKNTLDPYRPAYRGVELERFLRRIERWIPRARRLLEGKPLEGEYEIPPLEYRPET